MENKDTFYREMRKLANENLVRSGTSLDHIIFVALFNILFFIFKIIFFLLNLSFYFLKFLKVHI